MKIFISYEKKDTPFVEELTEKLAKIDINTLKVNLKNFLGEDIFDLAKLNRAVPDCDQVIVVLSKAYVQSSWLAGESWAFIMKERVTESDILLPIIIDDCDPPVHLKDRICSDFSKLDFQTAFDQLIPCISKNRQVFIVMKHGDEVLDSAYERAIKPTLNAADYKPLRIDRLNKGGKIDDQILTQLARSEMVLSDLTGQRPNCYYETGYAHALGKELILTIKKGSRVHFNLSTYEFIEWKDEQELRAKLEERLNNIRQKNRQKRHARRAYERPAVLT